MTGRRGTRRGGRGTKLGNDVYGAIRESRGKGSDK